MRRVQLLPVMPALLAGALFLSACTPDAGPTPMPTSPSVTPSATTSTPTPTNSPTASPSPTQVPEQAAPQLPSDEEAVEACLARHQEWADDDVVVSGEPQIWQRTVYPYLLVQIPATNPYGSLFIECFVEGEAGAAWVQGVSEIAADYVTPEYLEDILHNNYGM